MNTSAGGSLRLLLLGHARSPFVADLARHLRAREGFVLGLVSPSAPRDRDRPEEICDDLYVAAPDGARSDEVRKPSMILLFLKLAYALWRRRKHYDCLHIHSFGAVNALIAIVAKPLFRHRIASVYGSDFYRSGRLGRMVQKRALSAVDLVTVANPETGRQLRREYGEHRLPPVVACRFGLTPLEELKKAVEEISVEEARASLGIPPGTVSVACAYSRTPRHRHLEVLEQLGALPREIRDSLFLVVPLTYGTASPGYVDKIEQRLERVGIRHLVLTSYLSDRETAELRLATDIFIHVPFSDQLSGTMQEHMFAGSIVVTGSWLPYRIFRERTVEFLDVASIEELATMIPKVVDDLENLKARNRVNRELIWEMSNWGTQIRAWTDVYRGVQATAGR